MDNIDKIIDVSLMPSYIQNDWVNYNKSVLNLSILNDHIKKVKENIEKQIDFNSDHIVELEEKLNILISIRRDVILSDIL